MISNFVDMKNKALASIEDWAQNNRHYETMQIRVGDFIDALYGSGPREISVTGIAVYVANCTGAAQVLHSPS